MPPKKEKEEEEEKWVPWGPEDAADKDPVMLREPVTMADSLLKSVMDALTAAWEEQRNAQGEVDFDSKGQLVVASMRKALEDEWEPTWHVIAGRNFGTSVTYQSNHFLYFSKYQIHWLVMKTV
eukprot:TRINITY_DN38742_c0_g1_i1.p2 TRINITY_DN38742_c0_g1~~TRINITY_DN38742_c0_g1_i1.p2  ORF type:complete len:123 (-),score=38.25 TRINITY_DN38742_c0_g1_i1:189-557(-)